MTAVGLEPSSGQSVACFLKWQRIFPMNTASVTHPDASLLRWNALDSTKAEITLLWEYLGKGKGKNIPVTGRGGP
jgi:hypothetical protein